PHVTGAAALYAAAHPGATAAEIQTALLNSASLTPTPSLTGKTVTGGRLNAGLLGGPLANDLAITAVRPSAGSLNLAGTLTVTVTVKNVGAQHITGDIPVTLSSDNGPSVPGDSFDIGTQTTSGGLARGASVDLTFTWNTNDTPATELPGVHTLTA